MFSKKRSILIFISIFAGLVAWALIAYIGLGQKHILGVANIKQGLDLKGGVSIVYQACESTPSADGTLIAIDNPTAEDMQSAISIIRNRLDARGSTEADVSQQNANRISVEIPGVYDAEKAVADMGQTALLTFVDPDGNVVADGRQIKTARGEAYQTATGAIENGVSLEFDAEATVTFAEATAKFIGQPIYIKLDDNIISQPIVNTAITDGSARITGGFTSEGAAELASLIRAGALPFKLEVLSTNDVGAKLGADSLSTSLLAGAIGGAIVLLFMLLIYGVAGLASDIALLIYVTLELLILSAIGATLTLPGIAGIVLSIGMAVDANVIIFERLKEELRTGRSMRYAIDIAFSKAFSAILDGNVTTLIAAAVLFWLGTGPIKGFAVTLGIGIIISMFSALVITKVLLKCLAGMGLVAPKLYGVKPEKEEKREPSKVMKVIANRKKYFATSLAVAIIGIAFMIFNTTAGNGFLNFDVEFTGGTSMQFDIGQPFNNDDIAAIITEKTGQTSPQIQKILGKDQVSVKMKSVNEATRTEIIAAIAEKYNRTPDEIKLDISDVSATVSKEMGQAAVLAVVVACVAMLIYVSIRFRNITTGGSAILALVHDTIIVLCAYSILRIPINYSFIAAILTVLGYSINATIVIFDRMRENAKTTKNIDNAELVDRSVSQTLTRSIYTSLTTLFTISALYIVGVQSVKEFALPIIIGIIAGTYSSVFLSGSMWYTFNTKKKKA